MNHIVKTTRLQLNKPDSTFLVPLYILGLVLVVSAVIVLAIQRAGGDPSTDEYVQGARMNMGAVWSLPGFIVYLGVQAIATTFPYAMALGATRRAFVAGTMITNLIQSLYIALVMLALLGLELLTDHWFIGIYALDVYVLGSGNPLQLFLTIFIGIFVCLSLGGVFGAVWVRFGQRGPLLLGIALALVLAITFLILVPYLADIIAGITGSSLAIFGVAVALLAVIGTWICMRRTTVR